MKTKWRMPHPATMFMLLTVAVIFASWFCDIYGLSIHLSPNGEEVHIQNLLSPEGLRWMLRNVITNFTGFAPLGMVIVAMFGLGIVQHSGFLDACIRKGLKQGKYESRKIIALVIALGLLSNLLGDAGYIILLPIAATMFRSVRLHPVAGIITAYVSVACGYSANLFLTVIDPMLSINTERASLSTGLSQTGIGPLCNYYFFFVSTFVIGVVIYFVTCRSLLPAIGNYKPDNLPVVDNKSLSRKERRAFNLSIIVGLVYASVILLATFLPFGILRGVDGGLLYSPFMMGILFILSLGAVLMGIVYGFSSGRYRNDQDVIDGLVYPINLLGVYFVIAFFASQLYACFSYSHLDKYLAVSSASLLTSMSASPLITLLLFILLTACINLILTSATAKWNFMAFIFVPFFAKIGVSPDITQCAFRIGDSATNAITPFLFYMPLVLTFMQQYNRQVTYASLLRYTWRYSVYILLAWMLLFAGWYLCDLPFGL